jgi:CRISPR-associated exonuclease Cas4
VTAPDVANNGDLDLERYLALSALQHYAYCPRQCALIHTEQVWADNVYTAQGNALHARVDSGAPEQRGNTRSERAVQLLSHTYKLTGKMDLLEVETAPANGTNPASKRYFPVEYKRGKPKVHDWDRIQVCAQALCIEEMRGVAVNEGAIWYWEVRRREAVAIDARLREVTIATITAAHALLAARTTPPPTTDIKRCKGCSLLDICQPALLRNDHSAAYVNALFSMETPRVETGSDAP